MEEGGAREPGSQGAREPGSQGAREGRGWRGKGERECPRERRAEEERGGIHSPCRPSLDP